jgi:hypothetical protein
MDSANTEDTPGLADLASVLAEVGVQHDGPSWQPVAETAPSAGSPRLGAASPVAGATAARFPLSVAPIAVTMRHRLSGDGADETALSLADVEAFFGAAALVGSGA